MSATRKPGQFAQGINGASGTTLNVTLNGITNENAIGVIASYDTGAGTGQSIADDLSVAPHLEVSAVAAFNQFLGIWTYKNYGGGNRTFTLTNAPANTNRMITVVEVQGADKVNLVQGTALANGSTAAVSTGNLSPVTTLDGAYFLGAGNLNPAVTPTGSYVVLIDDSAVSFTFTEDQTQAVHGNLDCSWTNTANPWQAMGISMNPASIAALGITKGRGPLGKRERRRKGKNAFVAPVTPPTTTPPTRTLTGVGI